MGCQDCTVGPKDSDRARKESTGQGGKNQKL